MLGTGLLDFEEASLEMVEQALELLLLRKGEVVLVEAAEALEL